MVEEESFIHKVTFDGSLSEVPLLPVAEQQAATLNCTKGTLVDNQLSASTHKENVPT